jgi:hypothetical protein
MADTAARLVGSVPPDVPVRQWVLSGLFSLRLRLASDAALPGALVAILIEEVTRKYRELARDRGQDGARCGAVTSIQRFDLSVPEAAQRPSRHATKPMRGPGADARLPSAELLRRAFRIDVLRRVRCGARRALIDMVTGRDVARRILDHPGEPRQGLRFVLDTGGGS